MAPRIVVLGFLLATQASVGRLEAQVASGQVDAVTIAKARADSARLPYTAADVHFMVGMIAHHAQAVVMAKWAPTHGAGAEVSRLCERILNAQNDEIVLMQRWLHARNQAAPDPSMAMMGMMHGSDSSMRMPGMLTEAQMKELDAARGPAFDRLFLRFMIQHHRGAVSMVTDLFATPGAGQDEGVFKLANDIQADQTTEINRMTRMLFTIPGE